MNVFVCINDVFTHQQKVGFKSLPKKDGRYILKEIVNSPIDGKEGYTFEELPNPSHPNGQEYSFRPSRFVPVEGKIDVDKLIEEEIHY